MIQVDVQQKNADTLCDITGKRRPELPIAEGCTFPKQLPTLRTLIHGQKKS
jgi:hypothetical protein